VGGSESGRAELDALRARVVDLERELSAARQTAARFQNLFRAANDSMFVIDVAERRIVDVNPRAARLLGYRTGELIGAPLSRLSGAATDRFDRFCTGAMQRGDGFTDQVTLASKNGRLLPAEISAACVQIDGVSRLVVSARVNADAAAAAERPPRGEHSQVDAALLGYSKPWAEMMTRVNELAGSDADALIIGEHGTGKNSIARALHQLSARGDVPLIALRCSAVGDASLADVLGRQGAPLGAQVVADGDTVFLDELGDLSVRAQDELADALRARDRGADVRVIASVAKDRADEVPLSAELLGAFGGSRVMVPALRDRSTDIPQLVEHFLDRASQLLGLSRPTVDRDDMRRLQAYSWPGNVRELFNTVERGVILASDGRARIELADDPSLSAPRASVASAPPPPVGTDFAVLADALSLDDLKRIEVAIIERAIERAGGKIYGEDGAAARLGLPPSTLVSRVKKLGLRRSGDR